MQDLIIDPMRSPFESQTGFYVRAKDRDGNWGSHDIAVLERDSLLAWLRADPLRPESVLLRLMGH